MNSTQICSKSYFQDSLDKSILTKNKLFNYIKIQKYIYIRFRYKYYRLSLTYNQKIINIFIFGINCNRLSKFKDYIILNDTREFLKRYYNSSESVIRLKRFYLYYNIYSKIYPNYTALPEGIYIYKNIQKKQIMIDIQEEMEMNNKKKENELNELNKNKNDVLSTDIIYSILNQTNNENIELLFNINRKNFIIEEENFIKNIIDIITTIEKYENPNYNDNINIDNNSTFNNGNVKFPLSLNIKKKIQFNLNKRKNFSKLLNNEFTILNNNILGILSYKNDKNNVNYNNHNNNKKKFINNKENINIDILKEKIQNNVLKLSKNSKSLINLTLINKKNSNNFFIQKKFNKKIYNSISNNSLKSKQNNNNPIFTYRMCGSCENLLDPIISRIKHNRSQSERNKQNSTTSKFSINSIFNNNSQKSIIEYKINSNSNDHNLDNQFIKKRNNTRINFMESTINNKNTFRTIEQIGDKENYFLSGKNLKNNFKKILNINSFKISPMNKKYFDKIHLSRNKNFNIFEKNKSNQRNKNNSMTKLDLLDITNIKQKVLKGIHIKRIYQFPNSNELKEEIINNS